ncbi:MAG: ATP-dependent DNA helicase, partial [Acidobacteriota bacterium]
GRRALGVIPTQETLVLERFFDESGGMQLVLHAPFGSRINKAWGLALRKRFCRQFNFELQAAATEDALLLSLGPQHSFPLADVFRYLHPDTTRDVLVQAFLDAPVFQTRWRWNTTISLAVPRRRGGRKLAPQLQRMLADDLMAAVFPDAAACLENIPGDRQIPDHPLVAQTVRDCLQEAMDFDGLAAVLGRIHRGELRLLARDTPEPSVFAHEILNAKPYAFLDDAPLEERRAHAVQVRRIGDPSSAGDLGALDPAAIARVRDEAFPDPRDAGELHDALLTSGFLTGAEVSAMSRLLLERLTSTRQAAEVSVPGNDRAGIAPVRLESDAATGGRIVVAAERLPELLAVHPGAALHPAIEAPPSRQRPWTRDAALVELLRGRISILGPTSAGILADSIHVPPSDVDAALLALEADGVVLRGHFSPATAGSRAPKRDAPAATRDVRIPDPGSRIPKSEARIEWCDRALLSRIHRYTVQTLRAEIEPVSPADFMRFLFAWQHVEHSARLTGLEGLREIVAMLDGYELAAGAWERAVLPARLSTYEPQMLDMLCLAGEVGWARLSAPAMDSSRVARLVPATPVALFLREHSEAWQRLRSNPAGEGARAASALSDAARSVLAALRTRGASFFNDLSSACGLDADATRRGIGALVACGLVASDGFSGLRALVAAGLDTPPARDRRTNFAGRWTALPAEPPAEHREADVETLAWTLLRRYGVVFRRVVEREATSAPWRDLARVCRRLEARGEIRGGRFVSGMSGEQFALPEAVERMREIRRIPADGSLVTVSAADPLNLAGIITAGERLRAAARHRIVYRDGIPLAVREGDFVRELTPIDPAITAEVARALSPRRVPSLVHSR